MEEERKEPFELRQEFLRPYLLYQNGRSPWEHFLGDQPLAESPRFFGELGEHLRQNVTEFVAPEELKKAEILAVNIWDAQPGACYKYVVLLWGGSQSGLTREGLECGFQRTRDESEDNSDEYDYRLPQLDEFGHPGLNACMEAYSREGPPMAWEIVHARKFFACPILITDPSSWNQLDTADRALYQRHALRVIVDGGAPQYYVPSSSEPTPVDSLWAPPTDRVGPKLAAYLKDYRTGSSGHFYIIELPLLLNIERETQADDGSEERRAYVTLANCSVASRKPIDLKQWDQMFAYFAGDLLRVPCVAQIRNQVLYRARQAAVTAIMARNMSHNLGSHVLSKVARQLDQNDETGLERFIRYLQVRMDCLSDMAKGRPGWSSDWDLVEIIQGFWDNIRLREHLCGFARINAGMQRIHLHNQQGKTLSWGQVDEETATEDDSPSFEEIKTFGKIMVDFPHGLIGAQALYIILENIFRNSAPNAEDPKMLELTLTVEAEDQQERAVRVEPRRETMERLCVIITDHNSPKSGASVVAPKLQSWLNEELIDSMTLEPAREGWGMKEIAISSRYLVMQDPASGPTPIQVAAVDREEEGRDFLEFSLHVCRPLAPWLWIPDEERFVDEAATDFKGSRRELPVSPLRNPFLVAYIEGRSTDYLERIVEARYRLPTRVVVVDSQSSSTESLPPNIVSAEPKMLSSIGALASASELDHTRVWKCWVEKRWPGVKMHVHWPMASGGVVEGSMLSDFMRVYSLDEEEVIKDIPPGIDSGDIILEHYNPDNTIGGPKYLHKNVRYYEQFSSESPVGLLLDEAIEASGEGRENDDPRQRAFLRFLEACAVRVAILDERIAEFYPSCCGSRERLKKQGVDILEPLLDEAMSRALEQDYEYLVIHQTILKGVQAEVFEHLKELVTVPVVVTGGGRPDVALRHGLRWIPFASLAAFLPASKEEQADKFALVTELSALRAGGGNG